MKDKIHILLNYELIEMIKKAYPETEGLTATGIVDWALRKLILQKKGKLEGKQC